MRYLQIFSTLCFTPLRLAFIGLLPMSAVTASAQAPKINVLFPDGGRIGTTVEVELRGSALSGAEQLVVNTPSVTGEVERWGARVDEKSKPLFQSKCGSCHELRSPSNRSMTPAQWASTVDRMVKVRQAPISAGESESISRYLQDLAKAGKVTARLKIAPDAKPGLYEVRAITSRGVSTAGLFEVGALPEVVGANGRVEDAQRVALPCIANGSLAGNAERHYFRFTAKSGTRLIFDLKAFRFDERTQLFFNPQLRLLAPTGKELVENHGYYSLDPLLDWTCQADGDYVLEVRDMLGRGNPGNVYRLSMGSLPFDMVVFPPAVKVGKASEVRLIGQNMPSGGKPATISAQSRSGVCTVFTEAGPERVVATDYPIHRDDDPKGAATTLPAGFAGRTSKSGEAGTFALQGLGTFEFEIFAERLGSTGELRAAVLDAKGRPIATVNGDNRAQVKLEAGKSYSLKVEQTSNTDDGQHVYYVEARPLGPTLRLMVRPDEISLRPGTSVAAEVVLVRRDRIDGAITVAVEDLPAGVTAREISIPPDRQVGRVILVVAPDTKPSVRPIRFVGRGKGPDGAVTAVAEAQEVYLYNNQPRYLDRAECVASVGGEPDFTASLAGETVLKLPSRRVFPVKVRVDRKAGFKAPVIVRLIGLPPGWVANQETMAGDKSEITLNVRPDGQNTAPFIKRDAALGPWTALVEAVADDLPFVVAEVTVTAEDK